MGNCLSTCAKRSETETLGQEIECNQIAETTQTNLATDSQVLGGEKVRDLVQQELQALQDQISHSQAVLAKLHFRFNDEQVSLSADNNVELAKVHRTTQTSNPDNLPKSLECVSVTAGTKEWQETTASCPAIVNTGVQTDDDKIKSNNTSGEYFLPPISPLDSQPSEPPSPRDLDQVPTKPFEPKPLGNIDLEIYRSCRKLSVLPEEETLGDETSPPNLANRLAPAPLPHHQAHSFESYLLPVQTYPSVQRQLSDPTPSPRIHPQSRRTSRSTCRPLQLQPDTNYFRFPDVLLENPKHPAPKSPPIVKFQDATDSADEADDFFPRITSPTYNILQDTVSQLISMSSETLDDKNDTGVVLKKESLAIPGCYAFSSDGSTPFKTPPDGSMISTPGFYTPQEHFERKLPDSSTSSAFHTPTSVSPGANHVGSKSNSNSSNSFKTPPVEVPSEAPSDQSSFSTPMYMSPRNSKRSPSKINNENTFTDVPDLKSIHTNSNLFVKPLPKEINFDRNRSMLSILLDEPRVQIDNSEESAMPVISFTSLDINPPPPAPVHSPPLDQVPSTSLSSPDASLSPLTPTEGLARTSSRRRLQRSLVRISSETPLELVPLESSITLPPIDVPAPAIPPLQESTIRENGVDSIKEEMEPSSEGQVQGPEGAKMRRTNSDSGSGLLGGAATLPASNSFPSLSDTVLKQLGALMEEVKQKEENQSSEKEVEGKFTSLMLAFKTDKLTLERRLELQMRLRDQAEHNMAEELNKLKAAVQLLSPLCTDSEKIELLEKVSEQVDALHKSTTRVSTSAEMHGAVQQENRLSKAVDIILRHVENLKQAYDKERTEHEETRKILTDNKISPQAVLKLEGRGMSRARLGSLPRKLSNTILEADLEDTTSNKDAVSSNPGNSQSRENVECAGNSSPSPQTSLLQRKPSRPSLVENRRPSQVRDTESDDESTPLEPVRETELPPSPEPCPTLNINRRISIQAAWLSQISEHLEWAGPVDQMVTHMRYGVAAVLLVAALAVFTSTFILPHTRLGS